MATSKETQAMDTIRENHMRYIAMRFLDETRILHLERALTDFLVDIDRRHQEEIRMLNLSINELIQNRTNN